MTILLNGKKLANSIQQTLADEVQQYQNKHNITPKLVAIIVGEDPASNIYVANKAKACKKVGIDSQVIKKDETLLESELIQMIDELNNDVSISGILVQLPLPPQINPRNIIEKISPQKDVDGFHPYNVGRLALRKPMLRCCTPYGIMLLLKEHKLAIKGLNATIIGVSDIVGRPLALEFLLAGATVTSCNSSTKNIEQHLKNADLIVSATGRRNVFDESVIPDEAIIIDVGIHRVNDKICGDLDFESLNGRVKYLTPVPGGVGPMTICSLLQNTFQAAKLQHSHF